jgi:hypothetical protein
MSRLLQVVAVLLALIVVGVGTASAQVTGSGTILVTVVDPNGGPLPGATVTASAEDATTKRSGVTDADGKITFSALDPSARYVVSVSLQGFKTSKFENILVRSGQTVALPITLAVGGVTEELTITAGSPLVDYTSAARGQDITLRLTESLPTGRSYQSYLQLVPGVMPDDPKKPGNPASKAGINYSDIAGDVGVSTDNFYYFNGINVTDGQTGTFGANLNTEIIQEQRVLTGGIPAEFVGAAGLLSNVITKSGTNRFSGSVNYFFQNDRLESENKNSASESFSSYDTAVTIGGPIMRDKAWFFGSYRRLSTSRDVTALDDNAFLRTVENKQDQGYLKGTWRPTEEDTLSFTFLNDPTDVSGRIERDITNAQDRSRVQGGNRWSFNYSRLWGNALIEVAGTKHDGEVSDLAVIRETSNTVKFLPGTGSLALEQLGGFGSDLEDIRSTRGISGTVQWLWGAHTFKGGLEYGRYGRFLNATTVGPDKAVYTSISTTVGPVSAAEIATGSFTQSLRFDPFNESDYNGFIATINGLSNRQSFYDAFDTNGDGTITDVELGDALIYNSTAGNPNGQLNYFRIQQVQDGAQDFKANGYSFFVQDTWRIQRFTLNLGVRAEQWSHYASEGTKIFTFKWGFAPRLSASYDVMGDGRHKVFAFYGRYYDPVRTNMTAFAGSISGRIREEQVFANGQWVNYRTRGGPVSQDAFFAPTTKTPYTDDTTIGYEVDLGRNMSFETTYTNRRTRDILEDYDHNLYSVNFSGDKTAPDTLFLPPTYFGTPEQWANQIDVVRYPLTGGFPPANFFIGTLKGGKRDYHGVELTFRKRYADRWQALVSYTFSDAQGNSNSDSNADFQGDTFFLDPRAPFQYGRQPGSIRHLFKMGGSYDFDFGLQFGFGYRWNSGTIASKTFASSGRNLPYRIPVAESYTFGGVFGRWLAEDAVGSLTNPSWGQVDVRVQYVLNIQRAKIEMFMDIFNLANSQGSVRDQDLLAGEGLTAFGDPIRFQDPRRFFLGFRFGF